ncbi:hypothetical protein [Streptomyces cyaneogriseus]|uniref:hypothetical protein n=1 Tax=Streptomyces cyaneogriseus TaxID=68192 RepID=UPI00133199BC|nr:hypothetical protein [Streptomyces cyaneogriseus]
MKRRKAEVLADIPLSPVRPDSPFVNDAAFLTWSVGAENAHRLTSARDSELACSESDAAGLLEN